MATLGRAQVVTVSDRSYAGTRADSSGPLLAALLTELGFVVAPVVVVPDEVAAIRAAIRAAVLPAAARRCPPASLRWSGPRR